MFRAQLLSDFHHPRIQNSLTLSLLHSRFLVDRTDLSEKINSRTSIKCHRATVHFSASSQPGRPRQVDTVQEVASGQKVVPEASERNGLAVVTELEPQLVTNI